MVLIKDLKRKAVAKLSIKVMEPHTPIAEGVILKADSLVSWPCSAIPESGRVVISS